MRRLAYLTGLALLAVLSAFLITARLSAPGPVGHIVIATGGADGLYERLAASYQAYLGTYGVKIETRPELNGTASVRALLKTDGSSDVQASFVMGGFVGLYAGRGASVVEHHDRFRILSDTRSVGRLLEEPLWVFSRKADGIERIAQLQGKKIAIGAQDSIGQRLARRLLDMNDVTERNSTLINVELDSYGKILVDGDVDVAFLMLPSESKTIADLVREERLQLLDFSADAATYLTLLPFLTTITMPRGSLEFPAIPPSKITLLGTTTALIVRKDLHPALIQLLTQAVIQNPRLGFDDYGDPVPFYRAGVFPSNDEPEIELAKDARLIYKTGELPTLLRLLSVLNQKLSLPFWLTAFLNEHAGSALLLMVPILSVLVPIARLLPVPYNWFMRRRIMRWYLQLKAFERSLEGPVDASELGVKEAEIERIDMSVIRIRVPLNFSDQSYDLRVHIDLIRKRLAEMRGQLAITRSS